MGIGPGRAMMDFDVQRCSRHCAATGRELREGETFYSVLISNGATTERLDYSVEAWSRPTDENVLACWKSQIPRRVSHKARMAPNDVLLEYFQHLEGSPEQQETLYVLALLLIRRRVLRLEEHEQTNDGTGCMVLYNPRDESTHRVRDVSPSAEQIAAIQQQLEQLLFAGAE